MDGFSLNLCVKYFVGRSHVFPTVGTKNVTLREIMRWRHTRTSSLFVTITWVLFVAQYLGFLSSEFTKSTSVNWKIVQRYIARSCSQLLRLHGVSGSSVNKCRVVIHWHWHMKPPQFCFAYYNLSPIGLGSNQGLRSEWPASIRLRHGTATVLTLNSVKKLTKLQICWEQRMRVLADSRMQTAVLHSPSSSRLFSHSLNNLQFLQ